MKKVAKKITEKYVATKTFNAFEGRFDNSMRAVAKSFADNAEVTAEILTQLKNMNEATTTVLKEVRQIHEDNKDFRKNLSSLTIDGISYDKKIEGLTVRVEKLEAKSK